MEAINKLVDVPILAGMLNAGGFFARVEFGTECIRSFSWIGASE